VAGNRKVVIIAGMLFAGVLARGADSSQVAAMKSDVAGKIDSMQKQIQVMVDEVFSFGELGFQ
jgi:hypothetical protein